MGKWKFTTRWYGGGGDFCAGLGLKVKTGFKKTLLLFVKGEQKWNFRQIGSHNLCNY